MEKFTILGKDLAYHGTIIDFYKLKLRTPAGHEVSWDHIEHKGASAVLPIDDEGFEDVHGKKPVGTQISLVPTPEAVLDSVVPNYIHGVIYGALVESFCSEQNSRMMAMQSATNNAKDMLHDLNIEFNRIRQAAITQEITEVIAGAKAQKKKQE